MPDVPPVIRRNFVFKTHSYQIDSIRPSREAAAIDH